jgi:hypothetical protein
VANRIFGYEYQMLSQEGSLTQSDLLIGLEFCDVSIWGKSDITIWRLQPVFKLFSNVSVPAISECPG